MSCLLHRERMDFPSYDAYEAHYAKEHLNRCIECRRNFPSPLYLSLHGDEWHDPFVAVKRDKGEHTVGGSHGLHSRILPMFRADGFSLQYACFVEGCERKCASSDKRRRHLIDKHNFPKSFFFSITQYGIDGRQSLLDDGSRRRHYRRPSISGAAKKDQRRRTASISMTSSAASAATSAQNPSSDTTAPADNTDTKEAARTSSDDPSPVAEREPQEVEMNDLARAMSDMSFIPRSVKFGRGGGKAGFARRQ